MRRRSSRASKKAGLVPGTLVHVGEKMADQTRMRVIDYDGTAFREEEARTVADCLPFKETPTVTWLNVDGIHDVGIVEQLGRAFGLHPLILEDIVNTEQRPKLDEYEGYLFAVVKMLYYDTDDQAVKGEQVSIVLSQNFVISFQEREGDVFDPIRERIRQGKGRIRQSGSDYLAYALIDAIVDNYFKILETIGEEIEKIEEELVGHPTPETLREIHRLRREMVFLRRSIWPLREVISGLQRADSSLIREPTVLYLRDVHDHTIRVLDTLETYREMVSAMLDIYLSSLSNRMNEVMKVLTIFAAIFIPLTFIAGIYGMNFQHMPELEWRWGYYVAVGAMGLIGISMLAIFKVKRWF
jgi:magnesium transporter